MDQTSFAPTFLKYIWSTTYEFYYRNQWPTIRVTIAKQDMNLILQGDSLSSGFTNPPNDYLIVMEKIAADESGLK